MKKQKRRHPQPPLPRGPKLEEIYRQIDALQKEGKYEEILRVIEEAPLHLQQRPELMLAQGMAYLSLDDAHNAREVLEAVARKTGDFPAVHALLGITYMMLDLPGHAIRSFRTALQYSDYIPPEILKDVHRFYEEGTDLIGEMAEEEIHVSPQEAEEVLFLLEEGESAAEELDLGRALRLIRQAQQKAPGWWMPYALELEMLWFDGRPDEVLRVGARAAERFPDHPSILGPMVWAAFFRGQRDLAEQYAEPLKGRRYQTPDMLEKAVLTLGLLEDDAALFQLYELNRRLLKDCPPATFMILAAAAANLQRWGLAEYIWRLLDRREEEEGAEIVTSQVSVQRRALRLRKLAPGRNSRYSTVLIAPLMPIQHLVEIFQVIQAVRAAEDERDLERARKQVRRLAKRYFLFPALLEQLFLEDEDYLLWAELLLWLERPESDALLLRVAQSSQGPMTERLHLLSLLARYGKISPGQMVQVWDETRKEWRTLPVPHWEIISDPLRDIPENLFSEVADLFQREEWAEAQAALEKIQVTYPDLPEVYLLLGEAHAAQQRPIKAMELYQKALELDPESVLARCSIASLYLREKDTESARRVLEPLSGRTRMRFFELNQWLRTMAKIYAQEKDLGLAQFYVEKALELNPEDPVLKEIGLLLDLMREDVWEWYRRESRERSARKRRRPIQADASLAECLNRISKESLQATARAMPAYIAYAVRKPELVQRLVEVLTDPDSLEELVADLSDQERSALRDVLEAGGVMKWETFTEQYGDDLEESPFWAFHEPQTLMGRLRLRGLLSDGTVDGEYVVLIPKELRELLPPLLEKLAQGAAGGGAELPDRSL